MNIATQGGLQSSHTQMPFHYGHLNTNLNFILQSAEYLGLNMSHDDIAVVMAHKNVDIFATQQAVDL